MHYAVVLLIPLWISAPWEARAELVPFAGTLEVRVSVGTSPDDFELLKAVLSGVAEIDGGTVRIPAGALSVPVPDLADFGGNLVNGAATFSSGGAGAGSTCPLTNLQEVCIAGGGFGGVMRLAGVTHRGQSLVVWGVGGSGVGSTVSGAVRSERAARWTQGSASAWYFIPEIDPTPFAIQRAGSFRGLPSTFAGAAAPGFSLVTPMVVTAVLPGSASNVRAVATLRIDLGPSPVPIGGVGLLAVLLVLAGLSRLRAATSALSLR